jgi:hypothetical protein
MRLPMIALLLFACACSQPQKNETPVTTFDEAKEKATIMQVIEKETDCFFKRDYNCWKECFVQSDYAFQAWNNSDGGVDTKSGWKEIDEKIKAYIGAPENKPVAKKTMGQEPGVKEKPSSHPKVIRKNMVFKFFSEKLAYLMWDQYNSEPDEQRYTFSKDCRIMEKINGEWKIANVTSYWDYRKVIPAAAVQ